MTGLGRVILPTYHDRKRRLIERMPHQKECPSRLSTCHPRREKASCPVWASGSLGEATARPPLNRRADPGMDPSQALESSHGSMTSGINSMLPPSSVTTWLQRLRAGDTAAAQPLWERYYADLVRLAHDHLAARVRRSADAEDVALGAFASFCRGAAEGRFPQLADRHDLWRLLFTVTLRHAADQARREGRQRRGGGQHIDVADLLDLSNADLDDLAGNAPDPAWAAAVADELQSLLVRLPGDDLRQIMQLRLEGHTLPEIARVLGRSLRSIERKWALIRQFCLEKGE
jgi:RNA polymerase sigma factor (sigma-70 family)